MRWVHALGAAVAATTLVSEVAQATLALSLTPITVNGAATGSINGGSGAPVRTYQLKVVQTLGEKWNVGNLQVTLGGGGGLAGYFYAAPGGDHDPVAGLLRNNNINNVFPATDPNFYDTMVSTPQFDVTPTGTVQGANLNVTGSADWPVGPGTINPAKITTAGNTNSGNQTLNIVWGDKAGNQATTATDGTVSYLIGQFTIVGNTGAFLKGYIGGTAASNTPIYFTPNNATGALGTQLAALNSGNGGVVYLPILGDADRDGAVGGGDVTIARNNFGTSQAVGANGDVDNDGVVGGGDVTIARNNFGNTITYTPPPGGALGSLVPEPTSLAVIGMSLGMLASRRRKD